MRVASSGVEFPELAGSLCLTWESHRDLEQALRRDNRMKHGMHSRWDVFGGHGIGPRNNSWSQRLAQWMRCKAPKASTVVCNHSYECDGKWSEISKRDDMVRKGWVGCINCAVCCLRGVKVLSKEKMSLCLLTACYTLRVSPTSNTNHHFLAFSFCHLLIFLSEFCSFYLKYLSLFPFCLRKSYFNL